MRSDKIPVAPSEYRAHIERLVREVRKLHSEALTDEATAEQARAITKADLLLDDIERKAIDLTNHALRLQADLYTYTECRVKHGTRSITCSKVMALAYQAVAP